MINNKNLIRQTCQLKRQMLSRTIQKTASQRVCLHIQMLAIYQHATHIALYQAIGGEIDLSTLWVQATADKKRCYMPMMHPDKTLTFVQLHPKDPTKTNDFKIKEPLLEHAQVIALDHIDLMLIPLVAFDHNGTRLGRGAGYYDRTLANQQPACMLGVAYAFQQQNELIKEPWDISMDGIVTEEGVYWV